jgi:hypothetical protein
LSSRRRHRERSRDFIASLRIAVGERIAFGGEKDIAAAVHPEVLHLLWLQFAVRHVSWNSQS